MRAAAALIALAGAAGAYTGLDRADTTRMIRAEDNALLFAPNGRELALASSGFEEPLADVLWVRAVITFGERWEHDPGSEWVTWLTTMIDAINTLDPRWRTPYFYGGILLRVLGEVDASDRVFQRGAEAMPEDWFFPFSVGMNYFVVRDDLENAAVWLGRAAPLPGAPPWVASTVAELKQRSGERGAAIGYLQDLLRTSPSPEVRADAERQLRRLFHNSFVDAWAPACREYRDRTGSALTSPAQLEAILGHPLPPNPRGDAWIVGADGVVRSATAETERVRRALMEEMKVLR